MGDAALGRAGAGAVDKGDAGRTRSRILDAARRLFAERDISSVSIRDIAEAAQVSHGLVQRYFGTRDEMIEGIIRQEIETYLSAPLPVPAGDGASPREREEFQQRLKAGLPHFHEFAALIVRAELGGVEPWRMLGADVPTPAARLAESIDAAQCDVPEGERMDARLVSAYVNAALFAFSTMSPWLMASVGLSPEDYEERLSEIIEISVRLIQLATSPQPDAHVSRG